MYEEQIEQYIHDFRFSEALHLLDKIEDQAERKNICCLIIDTYRKVAKQKINKYRRLLLSQNPVIMVEESEDEEETQFSGQY